MRCTSWLLASLVLRTQDGRYGRMLHLPPLLPESTPDCRTAEREEQATRLEIPILEVEERGLVTDTPFLVKGKHSSHIETMGDN